MLGGVCVRLYVTAELFHPLERRFLEPAVAPAAPNAAVPGCRPCDFR